MPAIQFKRITFFLFVFFLCFQLIGLAQDGLRIRGKIVEEGKEMGLPGAACVLLRSDSTIATGVQSGEDGLFFFKDINSGKYILKIQYLGFETRYIPISVDNEDVRLGPIGLKEATSTLNEVKVVGRIPPVRQLGDTTQFNADGFKTNRDASAEELVTKMPGVTVQDGKVNVQGEEVKRILVDNKPFFGDDPSSALKNIPAEMIDKIQVFDQASEQSRFTGFNDGNTTKTLNIVTRSGMRSGTFGKVFAGAGNDDRYKSGLVLNKFSGSQRISFLGQANNINEQNFAVSDLMGAFGAGGGGGGRGSGGMGGGPNMPGQNFLVNAKKGIVETQAGGINYSDAWGKKVELTSSYFFNRSQNNQIQNTRRTYVLARDSGQAYQESTIAQSTNMNHRFNLRLTLNLDSNNSILYTPRFSYQQVESSAGTLGENAFRNEPQNSTNNRSTSEQSSYSLTNEFLLRHKFRKKGRTISLNTNIGNSGTSGLTFQNSDNIFFKQVESTDSLRQKTNLEKTGWSIQNSLVFTEPLSESSQAMITIGYNYAESENNRILRKKVNGSLDYPTIDTLLSNRFKTNVPAYFAGLGYAFTNKKSNLNANINLQQSHLNNDRTFPSVGATNRTFQNVLPSLMWRYSFSEKKNFRLFYRTSANAPSVDQLQDVVNNSNPLQLSTGNASLRQDYQQSMFFRYMSTREKDNSSFFFMIGGTSTRHYIGTSTLLALKDTIVEKISLARGSQLTRPVNLDGYLSVRTFTTYSLPIPKWKINININAFANFVRTPGMVNGKENMASSPTVGGGLGLSSNISKNIDFNIGYNPSYTTVRNSLNANQNNSFLNQNLTARLNFLFWERLVVSSDVNQTVYSGLSAGFNSNFTLLGMGIGYKFLKNRQAELRATVFDLLNQNTNISRTITETYTEDVRSNNLTRYFMVTFTYNLRSFNQPAEQKDNRPPGMPPGMHFRPH